MSESNISVAITADVADLRAKVALASADFKSFSADTRNLAAQFRAASDEGKASLLPQLQAAATSAAAARTQMAAFNAELQASIAPAREASLSIKSINASLESTSSGIGAVSGLFAKLSELFLVGFGVERITALVEKVADLGEELEKTSVKTGIAVETLSGWRYAADHVGVSADSLNSGVLKLGKNIQEALINPTSKAAEAFRLMGISEDFLRDHSNDAQAVLMKMADAFHAHADGAQADAIAQAALSRAGADLIPFLRQGSQAIQDLIDRQKHLGDQMTGEVAEAMEKHKQAVKDVGTVWDGLMMKFTTEVEPTMTHGAAVIAELFSGNLHDAGVLEYARDIEIVQAKIADLQTKATEGNALTKWWATHDLDLYKQDLADLTKKLEEFQAASHPPGAVSAPIPPAAADGANDNKSTFGNMSGPEKGAPSALETFRSQLAQMEAAWDGTRRGMLAESVSMWQQETQASGLSARERLEAETGLANATKALRTQDAADAKAASATKLAITKADTATDIQIAKLAIEGKKSGLDEEVAAHKITAQQKLEILRDFTNQEYALDLAAVQHEMAALQQGTLAYDHAYNEIRALHAKSVNDNQAIDRAEAIDRKAQLAKMTQDWKTALQPINSAFSQSINGMIQGTQTLAQGVQRLGQSMVLSFADSAEKRLSNWIATELAELTAHEAGDAAKVASTTAAAATTKTIESAAASKSILTKAYDAAAGAYDAVVSIPYVGPFLAPAAAAVAFAGVAAFGSGISAAGGYDIPAGVDPIVQTHAREMILPAQYADVIRGLAGSGGGGGGVHFHAPVVQLSGNTGMDPRDVAAAVVQAVRDGHLKAS